MDGQERTCKNHVVAKSGALGANKLQNWRGSGLCGRNDASLIVFLLKPTVSAKNAAKEARDAFRRFPEARWTFSDYIC